MASSERKDRVRAALRRRPIYYAVSMIMLLGGVVVLKAVGAPTWPQITFLATAWAALMYVLRWRAH